MSTVTKVPKDYPDPLEAIKLPSHLTTIWIAEDVALYSRKPKPNAWRRFWTWAFFGWRWKDINK